MEYQYDPEIAPFTAIIPDIDLREVEGNRLVGEQAVAGMNAGLDRSGTVLAQHVAPGADGQDIPLRVIAADVPDRGRPLVLDLHGGGFVMGSAEASDLQTVDIARGVGAVVVSVEYRLAPENPYPAGLEDCYSALVWAHQNAGSLGADPDRIAVIGQSAGGGLALALALLVRDRGGPSISFLYLGVPEVDDRLDTPSMRDYDDTLFWKRSNAVLSWQYYLGDRYGDADLPLHAAPGRARPGHPRPARRASADLRQCDAVRSSARRGHGSGRSLGARRGPHRAAPVPGHLPRFFLRFIGRGLTARVRGA